ncbi:hypothetical protein BKA65DRAFT_268653 [Rhexocercosporidium sp. MPI-PUGE-AT-0058]|nr:hypothetical protein BKA65DRAFT_268653 [Rhexocercosporidium sp. MPI-PUGE-AT-0058]
MSCQHPSELGPEAGGWLHEPCWAAEAEAGNVPWREKHLDLESFASTHSPHEIRKKEPNTPMAEDIEIVSRREPSSAFVGRSVDATTTRQSNNEVQAANSGTHKLHSPQRGPPSTAPININLSASSKSFKPPQEYFPIIPSTPQSTTSLRMEPVKHSSEPRDDVEASEDDCVAHGMQPNRKESRRNDTDDLSTAWKEVRDLRDEILGLRSLVHQKRVLLREMGRAKAEADNLLFSRMMMVGKGVHLEEHSLPGLKSLQQLMDECQDARNKYGPEEDDCIALEDKLSRLEFKLSRLEQPFFLRGDKPHLSPPPAGKTSIGADVDHDSESYSSFDDEFEEPPYHPMVTRYLSRQGDLDLLLERRDNLLGEKRALEGEKASRARFGMVLTSEDQAWLDGSQAEYDSLVKEIDLLENELGHLKRDCLARGLVDEDGEPTDFQILEEASFKDEEDLNPKDQTSEYVKYPKLLPLHPGRKHEDLVFNEPEPDETSDIPSSRINKWILGSLRISPLEVNFLARIFESRGGKTSTQWEIAVLEHWFTDDTTKTNTGPGRAHASSLVTETDITSPTKLKHPGDESQFNSFFSSIRELTFASDPASELLFAVGNIPTSPKSNI